jgi:hypothetical protein
LAKAAEAEPSENVMGRSRREATMKNIGLGGLIRTAVLVGLGTIWLLGA